VHIGRKIAQHTGETPMTRMLALLMLLAATAAAAAADRFPLIQPDQMNAEQKKLIEALLAGPRGGGTATPEAVQGMLRRGPFNAWLRSPELGNRLQNVGEYIRYKTSLPLRLNEFAILITAREWTSQYEWHAHHPLAMKAGLDPKVAEELANGKRPSGMKEDEAAVYEFCTQLHRHKKVDDAAFERARALFGEQGVVDLIGVSGYYTAVSMTLNVAQVPVPEGTPLPLKPLE
jgi:4-carboxymuconolactone decarboxylase